MSRPDLTRRTFLRQSGRALGATFFGASMLMTTRTARADWDAWVDELGADTDWGSLCGRFVYDGDPPPREKIEVTKDIDCCGKFDLRDESLITGPDRGVANLFVYLTSRGVDICPTLIASGAKTVVLDNIDCIFKPHCMTIWVGHQELSIINSDPVAQNVAFSPPGDKPANIPLAVGAKAEYTFRRRQNEPVPVACNYHPWESAYILPRDNPYAAVTSRTGRMIIPRLPLGKYDFEIWHERPGLVKTPSWPDGRFAVTIRPGWNNIGEIMIPPACFNVKKD